MRWRIVPILDEVANDRDLTSSELIGISILLINYCKEPYDKHNVYYRAWEKIQPEIEESIKDEGY